MNVQIAYPDERYFESFYQCISVVAAERIYLEMVEPPPFEVVATRQRQLIEKNGPVYYALNGEQVVGWCDIFPYTSPRLSHRGSLGMGLLPNYRGYGIGTKLIQATLKKAQEFGLEKVELEVYASNPAAVALYRKLGFVDEGFVKNYRKLDGQYFDCFSMAMFL